MPREKEKPGDAPGDARHLPVRREWHRPAGRVACKLRAEATPSKTPFEKAMHGEETAAGIQGCIPPGNTPGGKEAFREGGARKAKRYALSRKPGAGDILPEKEAWSIAPGPSRRSEAAEAEENTRLSGKPVARGGVKGRPQRQTINIKAKSQDRKLLSEKQQQNSRAGRTAEAGALPPGPGRRGPPLLPFFVPL